MTPDTIPDTDTEPNLSTTTRAELRHIADSLRRIRSGAASAEASPSGGVGGFRLRIGSTYGPQAAVVEMDVSPETLARIAQLIAHSGVSAPPRRRRRGPQDELTTQEAAYHLGVSRPFLIRLIEAGEIPCRLVGRYRRIRRDALEQFVRADQERRRAGLQQLADLTQEIGLEY